MILNVATGKQLNFDFSDLSKFNEYESSDILSFYPADGHSSVHYLQSNLGWEFDISVPMSAPVLTERKAEITLEKLWNRLDSLNPKFAVGGEELSLEDTDISEVFAGSKHPLEISLCHIAISFDALVLPAKPNDTKAVPGGRFQRAFMLFPERAEKP